MLCPEERHFSSTKYVVSLRRGTTGHTQDIKGTTSRISGTFVLRTCYEFTPVQYTVLYRRALFTVYTVLKGAP